MHDIGANDQALRHGRLQTADPFPYKISHPGPVNSPLHVLDRPKVERQEQQCALTFSIGCRFISLTPPGGRDIYP